MATGLINIMKIASQDAMNNAQMCDLRFGKVVSASPLKIQVTSQLTLPESVLIVPEHLTNYSVKCVFTQQPIRVEGDTKSSSDHTHRVEIETPEKQVNTTMIIQNALKVGDEVALIRKQGGQSYYVLDRI